MQPQVRSRVPIARPRPRAQAERAKLEASAAKAPVYAPAGEAIEPNVRAHAEAAPPATWPYDRRDLLALGELARQDLFSGDLARAQALFEGLTVIAPGEPYFALGLALTYDRLGRKGDADAEYQRAATLDPSDAHPDINRAELLLDGGAHAQARELLARAVQKAKRRKDGELEKKASALLMRIDGKGGR